MKWRVIFTTLAVLQQLVCVSSTIYKLRNTDSCPKGNLITTVPSLARIQCAAACVNNDRCLGYCHGKTSKQCFLLSHDSGGSESEIGLDFYWNKDMDGYYRVANKVYKVSTGGSTWQGARDQCTANGMRLAIPVTKFSTSPSLEMVSLPEEVARLA